VFAVNYFFSDDGMAAVFSPVGELYYRGKDIWVGEGHAGSFSKELDHKITVFNIG
jgi:hypothetical protein